MTTSLRPAHMADLDAIHRIRREAILGIVSEEYPADFLRVWADKRAVDYFAPRVSKGLVVLAEVGGVAVGWGSSEEGKVVGVYVHPSAGRSGIGRRLVARLEEDIAERGYTRAELAASLNAVAFYTRLGYKKIRSYSVGDAFRMQRELDI